MLIRWGLGNALFVATALTAIVSASQGSVRDAIIFYGAALGVSIAAGPLIGGLLGSIFGADRFSAYQC